MKNIYSIILSLFVFTLAINAQTIVSTQQSKKKVLLEEFTGIHCTFCPDGHRIADLLTTSHPNKLFVVNIHAGRFAIPRQGEPDFRTTFGNKVDRIAALSGYPAGTINRTKFVAANTLALNRDKWKEYADTIFKQDASVNIAVDASIADTSKRKLSVLVETYVTNTNLNGKYLLNVYLVQNSIIGPQTGSFRYPAEIQPNNMYQHNKVLRAIITPEWGDTLDFSNASSNRLTSKTYNYTLPNDIKSVGLDIKNLYVVAFLTEIDKKNVLNVTQDKKLLPANISAILEFKKGNTSNPNKYCMQIKNTEITIKNVGTTTINSFDLNYTLGTNKLSKKYTGSLSPNQETKIPVPLTLINRGFNEFFFGDITNIKSSNNTNLILLDKRPLFPSERFLYLKPISSFPYTRTFENTSSITYNFGSNMFFINRNLFQNPPSNELGGAGKSASSLVFRQASTTARVLTDVLDFTNLNGNKLGMSFLYSGALVNENQNPSLSISYSDNCGTSWNELWKKSGKDLANNPPSNQVLLPKPNQWAYVSIPLAQLKGKKDILFEIKFDSRSSNWFYIDDIKIGPTVLSANSVLSSNDVLSIYPNPANKKVFIDLATLSDNNKINNNKPLTLKITDILGRILHKKEVLVSDLKRYSINTSTFNSGIYFLELSSEDIKLTRKLVIQE